MGRAKILPLVLVVVMSAVAYPSPSQAEIASRTPTAFYALTVHNLNKGNQIYTYCTSGAWSDSSEAYAFAYEESPRLGVGFVAGAASPSVDYYVRVKAGPADRTVDVLEGTLHDDDPWIDGGWSIQEDGTTLRFGYAVWGTYEARCRLMINSAEVPLVAQPPEHATYLRPGDFEGNVAIESSFAGANTAGSYSRYTDGWLFAMLVPYLYSNQGVVFQGTGIDGPNGEHQEGWSTVYQQTKGSWTYTLAARVFVESTQAVLWIIELPD